MKKKPKTPRAVIGTVLVFVVLLSVFMAGHIRNAMKRVRKKESAIIIASQNINDFLMGLAIRKISVTP